MGRIAREVVHFIGIVLEIEQQRRQADKMHILVAPIPDDRELAFVRRQIERCFRVEVGCVR